LYASPNSMEMYKKITNTSSNSMGSDTL